MRATTAIVIAIGAAGCRQLLGIDPGVVGGDAASVDDAAAPDDGPMPDMMIDGPPSRTWAGIALVPGLQADDEDPSLTGDMLEMYFTRGTKIYFMTRLDPTAAWSPPQQAPFTTGVGVVDQSPEITRDGLALLWASDRGAGPKLDVYAVTRASRTVAWGQALAFADLNNNNFDERPGSGTDDGARVTLSSDRNGLTGVDLYESARAGGSGTVYGAPVRIPLSTDGDDGAPFLTSDGLTLYYASAPALAPRELYVATRASLNASFTTSTRIAELCSTQRDSDPWVSPDGRDIYFSSDRDGAMKIWHASR